MYQRIAIEETGILIAVFTLIACWWLFKHRQYERHWPTHLKKKMWVGLSDSHNAIYIFIILDPTWSSECHKSDNQFYHGFIWGSKMSEQYNSRLQAETIDKKAQQHNSSTAHKPHSYRRHFTDHNYLE